MKTRYTNYAAALLALLLLLTSCASGGGQNVSEDGAVRLTETADLMETLRQVEAAFQDDATAALFDTDSATLRAETVENGVRVSAHWSETAWTAYFAVYAESGQMLVAAVAPDGVADWETVIVCDANQASTVKMFRLDAGVRPVFPAVVALLAAGKPEEPAANKILVAYFSATGITKGIAAHISDILDADSYEITPAVPYTSADLNYNDRSTRATVEQNDASARPAIAGSVANMEQYDVVFLGYPIWWGQAPRIISTFLESYDFAGKTVVPFCTSGSSPIGNSATNLHTLASGATWKDGRRFAAGSSRATVEEWVNGLNLPLNEETDAPKV